MATPTRLDTLAHSNLKTTGPLTSKTDGRPATPPMEVVVVPGHAAAPAPVEKKVYGRYEGYKYTPPETNFTVTMWILSMFVAAWSTWSKHRSGEAVEEHDWAWLYLLCTWLLCLFFCLPSARQALDRVVSKSAQRDFVDLTFATEGFGMVLFVAGLFLCKPSEQGWLKTTAARTLAVLGLFITSQGGLVSFVQRKTVGIKAVSTGHLMRLTTCSLTHHFASFMVIPNAQAAAFVLCWRFVSITTHSIGYLKSHHTPEAVVDLVGWGRYAFCVGLVQPLFVALMLGQIDGFPQVTLGLTANAAGHAGYMSFRAMRLEEMKVQRDTIGRDYTKKVENTYGRCKPYLEIEQALLFLASGLVVIRAVVGSRALMAFLAAF